VISTALSTVDLEKKKIGILHFKACILNGNGAKDKKKVRQCTRDNKVRIRRRSDKHLS
jgi:hypothetical protein